MAIDRTVILKVAELARLRLTEQEEEEFYLQLNNIVRYFERIKQIDTGGIEPAEHVLELSNVFQDIDGKKEKFNPDSFKKIVPKLENDHVVVPPILEEK